MEPRQPGGLRSRYRASTPFNARHRHKRELPCVLGGAFINPAGHWPLPCVVTTWVSRFMTEKYDPEAKIRFAQKVLDKTLFLLQNRVLRPKIRLTWSCYGSMWSQFAIINSVCFLSDR